MMSKKERMEKLSKAGIDTGKYFTLNVTESIPAGAKIHVTIDANGQLSFANGAPASDPVSEQIISDGYVRNTKLHRRFVMAQMFHMLNYRSYDGRLSGYTDYLHYGYGYDYTFKMMLEEVRVLSKLEVKDRESFIERSHFFTKQVVVSTLYDYVAKLKKYVDSLPVRKCKGVPYKRIKGVDVFVEDLNKKVYGPLEYKITLMKYVINYTELYKQLREFMKDMIKLPYETAKSKTWIDAYKGEGAYYTLKNLLMYHGCRIYFNDNYYGISGADAVAYIQKKLDEYQGEYYRMFALMKKVIKDNGFDFSKRMRELGVKGY